MIIGENKISTTGNEPSVIRPSTDVDARNEPGSSSTDIVSGSKPGGKLETPGNKPNGTRSYTGVVRTMEATSRGENIVHTRKVETHDGNIVRTRKVETQDESKGLARNTKTVRYMVVDLVNCPFTHFNPSTN